MRFIFALFPVFWLLLFSCKNGDKRYVAPGTLTKKDSVYTVVDSAGEASYLFHFTPAYGTTYYYTINTETSVHQEIAEKEVETTSSQAISFHYKITKTADGSSKLFLTYDNFKLKGKTGNNEIDINAAKAEQGSGEEMFKVLKGATFTAQISPTGGITSITGIKELQDSMYKLSGSNPEQLSMIKSVVDKIITSESMKQMIGPDYSAFPKKTVRIGDTWKVNSTAFQSDFKVPIITTYTLQDVEDGMATIKLNSIIQLSKQELRVQGYNVSSSLSGTQEGELKIDLITGTVENSEQEIRIKGKFEALGNEIPISLNYKNRIVKDNSK